MLFGRLFLTWSNLFDDVILRGKGEGEREGEGGGAGGGGRGG